MKAGRIALIGMAAFAVVMMLVAAYVTAYAQLGEYADWRMNLGDGPINQVTRHYADKQWCLTLFAPAAAVESKWIGCPVCLTYRAEPIVVYDTDGMDDILVLDR